jgi:hypothetical protein
MYRSEVTSDKVAMWKTENGGGGTNGMLTAEAEVMGNLLVVISSNNKNIVSVHVLGCAPENLELSGHSLMEM